MQKNDLFYIEKKAQFNSQLTISNTGGHLSTDAGLVLVKEFMTSIDFSSLSKQHLNMSDKRRYFTHDNHSILEQVIYQQIAGYSADSAATYVKEDPVFKLVMNKQSLASQPSISRWWSRFNEDAITQMQSINQSMIDKVRLARNTTEMIIDLDSTHSDMFGKQEATAYNAYYKTTGYHPLVAFDGLTGDFLKAELCPGNVYTSKGVADFVKPLLEHYKYTVPVCHHLVRGDSGFAIPELYELCESYNSFFVIRLKANKRLEKIAEELIRIGDNHAWEEKEVNYHSIIYRADSWGKARRVCIKSTREAGELLFRHAYIVTNLSDSTLAETVFRTYQQRGVMENFIKEAKLGFHFDKTDSSSFMENQARMMVSLLAYNIINFMRTLCFTSTSTKMQVSTMRITLFKIAGKLVRTGRRLCLKWSSYHVYQKLFYQVLDNIHHFSWA